MKRIQIAIFLTSLLSFIICIVNTDKVCEALSLTALFPILYLVFSLIILLLYEKPTQDERMTAQGGRITVSIYLALQWIRFVLFPAIATAGGFFSTANDLSDDHYASLSTNLSIVELIVSSIFCCVILTIFRNRVSGWNKGFNLSGNINIYTLFIIAMFLLYLFKGRDMYTFLMLSSDVSIRASLSDRNLILQALIEYGMNCMIIVLLFICYNKFQNTRNNQFIWIALVAALFRICIISSESESRMAILYSVGVFLLLLPRLFPSEKNRIYSAVIGVGVVVIALLTIYKTFNVFLYDSYYEAVSSDNSVEGLSSLAYTIDSYFYCVKDISRNLFVSSYLDLSYKNIVADIIQNIFGLKYLIPNTGLTTIGAYNYLIYNGSNTSGHLYSSIAYGYTYFTFVLAPISTCINLLIIALFEKLFYYFKSVDTLYIVGLLYVRAAASMFACFPFWLNYIARTIIIGFIVVGGASLFNKNHAKEL